MGRWSRATQVLATWVLISSGCAQGSESGASSVGSFGPTTAPPASTTTAPPDSGTTDEGTSDTALGSTSSASDTSEGSATTPDDPTSGTGDLSSTSEGTAGASTGEISEQPEEGMYSQCASAVECIGQTTCLTVPAAGGLPEDGICTSGGCMTAAAQCDPTPGGTAVPICLPQGGDAVCALDCSGGQICPAGMQCRTLPDGSICA